MNQTLNPPSLDDYLDRCEQRLVHPGVVYDQLRRQGWSPAGATAVTDDYRRRFNEHPLGYTALLVFTGVSALAAGSVGHTLTAGLTRPVNRNELAAWLAVLLCALPFAAWAHQWAARTDREDVVAVWSRSRRTLAIVLIWSAGVVGGLRLLFYAGQLVGALVGASWARHGSLAAGAVNVSIAIGIALPLGWWAYRFLHRFDGEDPTAPPPERPRPSSAPESPPTGP